MRSFSRLLVIASIAALPALAAGQGAVPAPPDVKMPPADAIKTTSGLAYKVLTRGTGSRLAGARDHVTISYTGWTTDGKMFDSTVARGEPLSFVVNQVIKGWIEVLELMVEGEKIRVWIPEELAYGGKRPPYGMLVFDIELLKIQ